MSVEEREYCEDMVENSYQEKAELQDASCWDRCFERLNRNRKDCFQCSISPPTLPFLDKMPSFPN